MDALKQEFFVALVSSFKTPGVDENFQQEDKPQYH